MTTARELLNGLAARPRAAELLPFHVAPISTGGVQLEWQRADGSGLEVWINNEGHLDAVLDRPAEEPRIVEKRLPSLAAAIREIEAFVV